MRFGPAAHLLFAGCLLWAALAHAQESRRIAVVVGRQSPLQAVTEDELRELFLKRRRMWPTGRPAVPVNLPAHDDVRVAFSSRILGRRPEQLVTYWDRQYFEGITPPPVVQSGRSMCAYVDADPDSIGYLAAEDAGEDCRVVLTLER